MADHLIQTRVSAKSFRRLQKLVAEEESSVADWLRRLVKRELDELEASPDETAMAIADDLMFAEEVARRCRVAPRTVRSWVATGRIRSIKVGRRHLIPRGDVAMLFTNGSKQS